MSNLRKPNQEEITQLVRYLQNLYAYGDDEDAEHLTRNAYIAVFDKYITGGPGYCGKLMMVVWDGCPSQYEVFIWEKGELTHVDQEPEFQTEGK